jgi:hypothetical protein
MRTKRNFPGGRSGEQCRKLTLGRDRVAYYFMSFGLGKYFNFKVH